MMRHAAGVALAAVVTCFIAQAAFAGDLTDDRLREGARRHDAGDYAGAIASYEAFLTEHPHDPVGVYELGFSMMARGTDPASVVERMTKELDSGVQQRADIHAIIGWAYDAQGKLAEGEKAFRQGLERDPAAFTANFNLGINLSFQERWSESVPFLEAALAARPQHVGSWLALGNAFAESGREPRAFFALARGAAAEPESPRARAAASRLWSLLFFNVHEKTLDASTDKTEVNITIPASADGSESAPDPVAEEALSSSIVAATRYVEKWAKKSDAEFFASALGDLTQISLEREARGPDPFWRLVLPFFADARKEGRSEALAYDLRRLAGDPEAEAWIRRHERKVAEMRAWAAAWKPPAPPHP